MLRLDQVHCVRISGYRTALRAGCAWACDDWNFPAGTHLVIVLCMSTEIRSVFIYNLSFTEVFKYEPTQACVNAFGAIYCRRLTRNVLTLTECPEAGLPVGGGRM